MGELRRASLGMASQTRRPSFLTIYKIRILDHETQEIHSPHLNFSRGGFSTLICWKPHLGAVQVEQAKGRLQRAEERVEEERAAAGRQEAQLRGKIAELGDQVHAAEAMGEVTPPLLQSTCLPVSEHRGVVVID